MVYIRKLVYIIVAINEDCFSRIVLSKKRALTGKMIETV